MKNSRKMEKTVLAAAAFAACAAVLWWWHLDGSITHDASTTARAEATNARVPEAGPAPVSPPPVTQVALASAPENSALAVEPASAESAAPAPAAARERAPTQVAAQSPSHPIVAAAVDSSSSAHASPTSSAASAVAQADVATAASVEEMPRHVEALDLFADRIANLEQTTSTDPVDATDARLLNEFNARAQDDEAAPQRVKVLRDHLGAWLASFPPERVDQMELVSVECRTASCQILIAEKTADVSPQLNATFTASFSSLVSEEWCRDIGLMPQSISMHAAGGGAGINPDHALWTIYLAAVATG